MPSYWYPDTCPSDPPCMIEDGARFARLCSAHAALHPTLGDAALITRVTERNQLKNIAETLALQDLNAAEGTTLPWSVDSSEVIHLKVSGTAQRRARIQAAIDARIGEGRVIVEAP